jgi:hypothetical protein
MMKFAWLSQARPPFANANISSIQDAQAAVIVSKDQLSTLHVADKCP